MKAREYAISLGLAKQGKGKLSAKAHEAIKQAIADGQTFEDYKDGKVIRNVTSARDSKRTTRSSSNTPRGEEAETQEEHQPIQSRPVTHDYSTIYGIDVRGRSPIVIAFQYCSKCIVQVRYCSHARPQLPEWIGGGDGIITEPTTEEAWQFYTTMTKKESLKSTKLWSEVKS